VKCIIYVNKLLLIYLTLQAVSQHDHGTADLTWLRVLIGWFFKNYFSIANTLACCAMVIGDNAASESPIINLAFIFCAAILFLTVAHS